MDAEFCIRNYFYRTVQLKWNVTFLNLMIYKLIEMADAYNIYTTANGLYLFVFEYNLNLWRPFPFDV